MKLTIIILFLLSSIIGKAASVDTLPQPAGKAHINIQDGKVQATQSSKTATIKIVCRATPSLEDKKVLYILDGVTTEEAEVAKVNTSTIERIDILKGSSAISLYGSKGANGVILIKTKGCVNPQKETPSYY